MLNLRHLFFTATILIFVNFSRAQENKIEALEGVLDNLDQDKLLYGGILVSKSNEVLYQKTFGVSKENTPNELKTNFNIASMGKMLTATAIMQLVDAGKLSLETKIFDIIPEYKNSRASKEISVYHLLTHTNGIPEIFQMNLDIDPMNTSIISHEKLIDAFGSKKLKKKPGKKWSYTNSGFVVLGRMIEKLSGLSYCDYIKQYILEPSGMVDTGCGFGAGGAASTLTDMNRFANALLSGKLISDDSRKLAMSKKEEVGDGVWCGYGFFGTNNFGGKEVSHSGGVPDVVQCHLMMFTDSGYSVVVYSNNPKGFDAYHKVKKKCRELFSN